LLSKLPSKIDIKEFETLTHILILTQSQNGPPKKWSAGELQGLILDPLLFPVYINNLPNAVEHKAIHILFTVDTSILIKT
jgi:hypothetical protein